MTTTNVKPYTDEDVENLRRSVNDARNNPPTPRVVRRLLATLDERTKERNKAKDVAERLRSRVKELEETLASAETSWDEEVKELTTEAAALREEAGQAKTRLCESLGLNPASTWQQVSEELETYVGNALALPNVEHQLEQAQAIVDDLCDEVERLRDVIDEVEDQWCDAEDRQHDTFAARIESAILRQYEARVAAESDLVDMAGQRDAAERRAEEARAHVEALIDTVDDDEHEEAHAAACAWLSTHPPQRQTPAPGDRCLVCEHKDIDLAVSDREVESLRSRVRELEGRLADED